MSVNTWNELWLGAVGLGEVRVIGGASEPRGELCAIEGSSEDVDVEAGGGAVDMARALPMRGEGD